tara:strand:- start:70 stop:213 length:144 start_codon:yes stop_codon:yes gene_type:complete
MIKKFTFSNNLNVFKEFINFPQNKKNTLKNILSDFKEDFYLKIHIVY